MISKEQENTIMNVLRPKTREEIEVVIDDMVDGFPRFKVICKDIITRGYDIDPNFKYQIIHTNIFGNQVWIKALMINGIEHICITTFLSFIPTQWVSSLRDIENISKKYNDEKKDA